MYEANISLGFSGLWRWICTLAPNVVDQDQGAALAWYSAVTCWCCATVFAEVPQDLIFI